MLEVSKLTKIFKSNKNKVVALNNVSFKLPDKGCAFIIGKSGSGKTTLLSLIGGLDDVTSGEIIYHGNKLSKFKHNEFDVYRNNEVGFIFQDYHLLEELTIFDNVKMMLDFKNIKDDSVILEALESVGLKGYENRYPKELSGGEKQRVAVARIIVKNPSIILADEPTGNLDYKTTIQILDLLKSISKEKLVLIVSHNKYDAYQYADYIFKLESGKIIEKYIRKDEVKDDFRVQNNSLYISKNRNMTKEELNKLKDTINQNIIKDINQNSSDFVKYDENITGNTQKFKNKRNHINFFNSLKYSFKFFKKGVMKSLIMSFLFGLVISVAALCFNISDINNNKITKHFLSECNESNFKIGAKEHSDFVNENIIDEIQEKCEPSHIFKGYNLFLGTPTPRMNFKALDEDLLNTAYSSLVYVVDEEFLNRNFGKDNKVEFIAKREEELKDGFYITDVWLENILHRSLTKKDINNIINYGYNFEMVRFNVNGIIKTDINEKYKDILSRVDRFNIGNLDNLSEKDRNEYCKYIDEIFIYPNALYTLNKNIYEDCFDNALEIKLGLMAASYENRNVEMRSNVYITERFTLPFTLNDNEIIISEDTYRLLTRDYDTVLPNYPTKIEEPFDIKIEFYKEYDTSMKNLLVSKTFKVVGVGVSANYLNEKTIREIRSYLHKPLGLLIEDTKNLNDLVQINNKYGTSLLLIEERNIDRIDVLVSSLRNFFIFILVILIGVILLAVFLYFTKTFKNNLFEIGVMKSLGARDKDVINMMLIDFAFTLLTSIVTFVCFEIPLLAFSNNVLYEGISRVSGLSLFNSDLKILYTDPLMLIVTSLIVIFIFTLTFIIQFIKIRRLKPVNIIKAKE